MNDFLMPYSLQFTSVVGETGLVLVPNQRSVQTPAGHQHWFPKPGVYMLVLTWNGVERATLTTYSNGVWRNPIQIPAGTGQRTSAPHIYSGIGASLRFGIVLDKPATTAENLAVVTVIPQETFKPSGGGWVVSGKFCRLLVAWWGGGGGDDHTSADQNIRFAAIKHFGESASHSRRDRHPRPAATGCVYGAGVVVRKIPHRNALPPCRRYRAGTEFSGGRTHCDGHKPHWHCTTGGGQAGLCANFSKFIWHRIGPEQAAGSDHHQHGDGHRVALAVVA